MFTISMMIHTFLSMMIGVSVVIGDYISLAIEMVGAHHYLGYNGGALS